MHLPEDFPYRVSVLAGGCCGGVKWFCGPAHIIHADRAIIATQSQQVRMLRMEVQAHHTCWSTVTVSHLRMEI